jgi:hypothetical protein
MDLIWQKQKQKKKYTKAPVSQSGRQDHNSTGTGSLEQSTHTKQRNDFWFYAWEVGTEGGK